MPPLHHAVVTAHRGDGRPRAPAQQDLEKALAGARGRTRRRRPGSGSPSPGACRTSAATFPRNGTCCNRSTCAPGSRRCSTRCGSRATRPTRSSSRTMSPSCSGATVEPTITEAAKALFDDLDVLRRRHPHGSRGGFAGGGPPVASCALAAGVPGADLIPDTMPSSSSASRRRRRTDLGPSRIANLETLGLATDPAAATSRTGRTCTSRTSTRTWRPGT